MYFEILNRIIAFYFIIIQYTQANNYNEDSFLLKQLKRSFDKQYPHYEEAYDEPELDVESIANEVPVPKWDDQWPAEYVTFDIGQVGGLAVCPEGNVHVFHRGERMWNASTFDKNDIYKHQSDGTLPETIEVLSRKDGKCLERLGKDKFYLPHGMSLDGHKHYWLTDVATHQVYKYDIENDTILFTLGEKFVPAVDDNDIQRFCKPSDVAVADSGDIFISDGYCNHRIMKFSKDGTFLGLIGAGELRLPHSIILIQERDLVCVAERESHPSRIICYTAGLTDEEMGKKKNEIQVNDPYESIYAITYNPKHDVIYAVTSSYQTANAYTIGFLNKELHLLHTWDLPDKKQSLPHDIDVSPNGDVVYIGMISPGVRKVIKFDV